MAEGSCKSLRKATIVRCWSKGLSAEEWSTLGTLGSVLPAPESIQFNLVYGISIW
jgi:hypothetical protein